MFGYHDSNRCAFDLWSPVNSANAIENRAFSAYAYHTQWLNEIADAIGNGRRTDISVSDDFTSDDLRYIEQVLLDKYGLEVTLTLES